MTYGMRHHMGHGMANGTGHSDTPLPFPLPPSPVSRFCIPSYDPRDLRVPAIAYDARRAAMR